MFFVEKKRLVQIITEVGNVSQEFKDDLLKRFEDDNLLIRSFVPSIAMGRSFAKFCNDYCKTRKQKDDFIIMYALLSNTKFLPVTLAATAAPEPEGSSNE